MAAIVKSGDTDRMFGGERHMAHAEPAVAVPEAPKYIVDDEDVSEGHS
jgi:hypothetical protein